MRTCVSCMGSDANTDCGDPTHDCPLCQSCADVLAAYQNPEEEKP